MLKTLLTILRSRHRAAPAEGRNSVRHWCSGCYHGVCTEQQGAHCEGCHRCQQLQG